MFHSGAVSGSHLLATIKLLSVVTAKKARGHGSRNKKKGKYVGKRKQASTMKTKSGKHKYHCAILSAFFFFCGVIKFKCTCIEGLKDPKKGD